MRFAIALGHMVVAITLTSSNVAFPDLKRTFPDQSLTNLGWVLSIYTIVFGATLVPAGRVADRVGRRRVFMLGLVVFSVGSVVVGSAPELWVVIAGRVVQGMGAACITPSALGLLLDVTPLERRAGALGFFSATASLGGVIGPTFGAVLIEVSSWRLTFLVSPVFAIVAWLAGRRALPDDRPAEAVARPDLAGMALIIVGLSALSLGIVQGRSWGWLSAGVLGAFAATAMTVPMFVWRAGHHPVPILPLALLKIRSVGAATVAAVVYGAATGAMLFANVQFLINIWGYSVVRAGLGVLPIAVASMLASPIAGRLGIRYGVRRVGVPGTLVIAVGVAFQALVLQSDHRAFAAAWIPATSIIGVGMALTYPMIALACVQGVDGDNFSVASATNRTALQVGNAIGLSTVIAILGASAAETMHEFRLAWTVLTIVSLLCGLAIAATSPLRRGPVGAAVPAIALGERPAGTASPDPPPARTTGIGV